MLDSENNETLFRLGDYYFAIFGRQHAIIPIGS